MAAASAGDLLDHRAGRADLDEDGGHPRLAQEGHRHAVARRRRARRAPRGRRGWTSSASRRPPGDSSWRPDQKAVRHPEVEGLRRSPTKTSTSSSLASLAWTASSGWCSSVTQVPPECEPAAQRARHAAQTAALADRHAASRAGCGGASRRAARARTAETSSGSWWRLSRRNSSWRVAPPDDAVDGEAGVALELAERPHRGVAEDAVDPAGVEAQRAQALLQLGDVVTAQHGGPAVQEAVAEPETGLDQGVPGLRPADAVDPQAAQALEGLEGGAGGRDRRSPSASTGAPGQDGGQAVLDVGDRVAAVPDGEGQAYR